jgi:hypothetical protein
MDYDMFYDLAPPLNFFLYAKSGARVGWIAAGTGAEQAEVRERHHPPLPLPMSSKHPAHRRKGGSVEVVDSKYAVDLATQQSYSENIFLFVPNLIG